MSGEPIRFIHAADLHLEQPISGIGPVPELLKGSLIDAPFAAAARVFETARMERVDFIVLSGDIVDPVKAGPAGLCFLVEQLEELAALQIPVFWAGGRIDRFHQWPKAAVLPTKVNRSVSRDVRVYPFYRAGKVVALIQLSGYQGRRGLESSLFSCESQGVPVIGVGHGELKPSKGKVQPVDYWALGGRHQAATEELGEAMVHYPGTPQGRSPVETGVHGCSLVEIDPRARIETQFIECDSVQWLRRELRLTASTSRRKMERQLVELTRDLLAESRNQPQLVQWVIGGTDRVSWTSPSVAAEVLGMLRQRFGTSASELWVTGVEFLYPKSFPEPAVDTDTIAGDFFEIVQQLRQGDAWPAVLRDEISLYPLVEEVAASKIVSTTKEREAILEMVARLGFDLLGADQSIAEREAEQRQALREAS